MKFRDVLSRRHLDSWRASRVATGSSWAFLNNLVLQLGAVLRIAVLARFLPPEEFGVMAIVLILLSGLETFTSPGFNQALIQRVGDVSSYFPAVFTINVLRGISLSTLIVLSGPLVAEFFHQPDAAIVLQVSGVIFLIRSLKSPALVDVDRSLEFVRYFWTNSLCMLLSFVCAVVLGALLHNVWALVLSTIVFELTTAVSSYVIAPWRLSVALDFQKMRELSHFSRWVVTTNILSYLSLQLDNILVGRILGSASLGIYEMAYRFSQLPANQISTVVGTVAFPAFSRLNHHPDRFRALYMRMMTSLFAVNLVIAAALFFLAEPIIRFALGAQWLSAVPTFRILAISGFIRSMVTVGGKIFYAAGVPQYSTYINIPRVLVFLAVVFPLARWGGIEGVAVAVLIATATVVPMYFWLIRKAINVSPRDHILGAASIARTSTKFRTSE